MKTKSLDSIDAEIRKVQDSISKAEQRIAKLSQKYELLKKERDDLEAAQIAKAYRKSGKSYHEIMTFLGD